MTESELYHHGIKGQKWGVRRFQNEDGTLTEAGKRRDAKRLTKELNSLDKKRASHKIEFDKWEKRYSRFYDAAAKLGEKYEDEYLSRTGDLENRKQYEKGINKYHKDHKQELTEIEANRQKAYKSMKDAQGEIKEKIDEVVSKGYNMTIKDGYRYIDHGLTIMYDMDDNFQTLYGSGNIAKGTYYKVKNPKKKE